MTARTQQRSNEEWLEALGGQGRQRDLAILDLRDYLLRAILVYLTRHRSDLAGLDYEELRQLAEDWAQQGLLKVLDQLEGFRGDSKLTTWAYRVAINLVASELRRKRWRNLSLDQLLEAGAGSLETTPDDNLPTPEAGATRQEVWQAVETAIAEDLTERQRQVITRVVLEGVSPESVAEALDTNRNNIYKILHDARRKLKQALLRRSWSSEEMLAAFARDGENG